MAPIRTAIIGLSSSAKTAWASAAHLPYLLSTRGREKYTIVALCNSSVDAAKQAITTYNLPAETKAYGDPQSLADDPDIDLVVCCTRVDVHHPTILPSVKAGKHVFVEWPLAQDVKHATELADASKASGSKTILGLQGRLSPPVVRVREILEQGRIGKVLSSELLAAGGTIDREILPPGLAYFADRAVGGNIYTIGFGHLFDQVQYILGDLVDPAARFQLQRPEVRIRNPETKEIVETKSSNVPDLILLTSGLPQSDIVQKNASFLYRFRRGQPFPGEPALVWKFNGEKGELRITSPDTALNARPSSDHVKIDVHDFETDTVERVEWGWEGWQDELPVMARGIGHVYDVFAAGKGGFATFDDALKRHKQLEGLLSSWST
ncbi:Galactose/lactose metabolism regulatory protein-like protein [Hapsidospora chrysogenum ATCC 11550]|uniref:Galactose/lactose metabolism regulatory protein-like protein n=1 Tax=Hapsidospora chrysogenum (strain ATCC 11550 / CBS 779.69 / DSM 880 / IAM 14645 / JCM 23072 / IMI 49137) TaxID=857340 RepID=A0A086TDI6_HAPC1|nr:Galactose/lactose metabolism regulatory protein-like protein [Hapsidospora chrysogenum ATCC 11550]